MKTFLALLLFPLFTLAQGVSVNYYSLSAVSDVCDGVSSFSYDHITYHTVQIGTQCWMKENLTIGTRIDASLGDQTDNDLIEKFCYDGHQTKCDTFGGLYQWDEAMQYVTTAGTQGICPDGWHIPTNSEFSTLTTFLGGTSVAGGMMKEIGTTQYWVSPNTGATNSSGFTGYGAGWWSELGLSHIYTNLRIHGVFWTSTQYNAADAYFVGLLYNGANTVPDRQEKVTGFSVRCIKN
ncbi:MAG: fibrobacter succinogenes major paralogous domain-containing protein [Bacteroidales bacterium]|nr:fibrobacter succinogenes major paralogous domain-containing protein [Bacteroidales bacterium]